MTSQTNMFWLNSRFMILAVEFHSSMTNRFLYLVIYSDTLFNWEIVVHPDYRGNGLQKKMLLFQLRNAGVSYLECTVNPSNRVSKRNFRELAKALKTQCKEDMMFSEKDFENDGHEAEVLFRIGPFSSHDIDCLVQPRDLNNLGACGKNNHD